MFYIFLLQTNDSVYQTATQESLDFDVYQLFNDAKIGTSVDPFKVLHKTLKKQNEEMVHLELTVPMTVEIKAKVHLLIKRCQSLKLSHEILM